MEFEFGLVVSFWMFIGLFIVGVIMGIAYGIKWLIENINWNFISYSIERKPKKKKRWLTRREWRRQRGDTFWWLG